MDETEKISAFVEDIAALVKKYEDLKSSYALVVAHLAARQIASIGNEVVRHERNADLKKLALKGELLVSVSFGESESTIEILRPDLTLIKSYPEIGE